jgi:hypothetical protein
VPRRTHALPWTNVPLLLTHPETHSRRAYEAFGRHRCARNARLCMPALCQVRREAPLVWLSRPSNLDVRTASHAKAMRSGASHPDSACGRNADDDLGSTTVGRMSARS